jgi:hypothetical protein
MRPITHPIWAVVPVIAYISQCAFCPAAMRKSSCSSASKRLSESVSEIGHEDDPLQISVTGPCVASQPTQGDVAAPSISAISSRMLV